MSVPIEVPCGEKLLKTFIPQKYNLEVLQPQAIDPVLDEKAEIDMAITKLIEIIKPKINKYAKVSIALTDRTRETPNHKILPLLLNALNKVGIKDQNIKGIIATGLHKPDTGKDLEKNVGRETLERIEIINNSPRDKSSLVYYGKTSFGTPLYINKHFAEASIKLATGNIVPCNMAGWTGGAKSVLPGVAGIETIHANHKMCTIQLKKAKRGAVVGLLPPQNIVRADIEETGKIVGLDAVINTVLNPKGKIIKVLAGLPINAHREGVEIALAQLQVKVTQKADLLIAGVGSSGFEASLYQGGTRILQHADALVKPGGTIIMVCECREGLYEGLNVEKYRKWMQHLPTPVEIERLTQNGEIPPEETPVLYAFSWVIHQLKCKLFLVSEMDKKQLDGIPITFCASLDEIIKKELKLLPHGAKVIVVPGASQIVPI